LMTTLLLCCIKGRDALTNPEIAQIFDLVAISWILDPDKSGSGLS